MKNKLWHLTGMIIGAFLLIPTITFSQTVKPALVDKNG